MTASRRIGLNQPTKLDAQHRRLNSIHARIPADVRVMVFGSLPVVAQDLDPATQLRFLSRDCAGFTKGSEVFARIKTETTRHADTAGLAAFVLGSVRLARVFDHWRSM